MHRVRKHESYVGASSTSHGAAHCQWQGPPESRPQPGVKAGVEHPGNHSCCDHGEAHVYRHLVDFVAPPEGFRRPQIEDAVRPDRRCRPVIEVEEPDGAVHQGEAHRQQRVDRSYRYPVEGKLKGLIGRLGDFPTDVGDRYKGQNDRQQTRGANVGQAGEAAFPCRLAEQGFTCLSNSDHSSGR